ncbi:MAG TPA: PSD1 and planctomycete cytochrome C domain-containing protein [Planctomycetota bacterium]|nr:PSD1 and planctomycete cytochrome C domain-containing protein [Planctomycetota bacterium]
MPQLTGLFVVCLAPLVASAPPVDYLREVKPILAEHCYRCHGASQQKAGFRIDTAASTLRGGNSGPSFQPGNSAESLLIQVLRGTHDDISRMPYKRQPLPDAQIDTLARWIDEGAESPPDERAEAAIHWAFLPPARVPPPGVKRADWPRNSIDHFILARLEEAGIEPSLEADRSTLIRRASLDLTGLPPAPAEVDEFIEDERADAYERLVDRLLGSPHHGERWGRHWLDVARYADSNGYSIDAPRSIWKYRDWVISAVNRDVPFDQFTVEQLAGDLLPDPTLDQKIATGFHRNTQINQEGGIDPEQFRVESVMDRVNTTATAFLGVTLACAQCHDHKFDPFTQREYYQFYAFFNNTIGDGHGKGAPEGMLEIPGETEATEGLKERLEEAEADLDRYLDTRGSDVVKWEQALTADEQVKLRPEALDSLKVPFAARTRKQKRTVYAAFSPDDEEFKQRSGKLARLEKRAPHPVSTLVMVERSEPRESCIFIKGDFTRRGDPVQPGTLEILHPMTPAARPNRLDLARWIVDERNPLTSRVIVNRIWQQYFGRGIVETENDFGTQGTPPSNPELLDWLATEVIRGQWSLKAIHRAIVTSATYRQSSRVRPGLAAIDPNNRLLARQSRLRLDAEIVRDVCLGVSGLLSGKIGGPGVFPPQPDGVMALGQSRREWTPSRGADRYRRGMYTFFWRATPHPSLMVFDSSDGLSACTRRVRSNTPLQALTLLNDEAFVEFSQALAARVLAEAPGESDAERMEWAFRLCLSRPPAPDETEPLLDLLDRERAVLEGPPVDARAASLATGDFRTDPRNLAAWTTVARVLLNLDEIVTRE